MEAQRVLVCASEIVEAVVGEVEALVEIAPVVVPEADDEVVVEEECEDEAVEEVEPEPVEEWEGERVLAPLLVAVGHPLEVMVSVGVYE